MCAVAAGVYVVLGGVDVHAADVLVDGVDALVGEHAAAAAADALATATAAVGAAHWDCSRSASAEMVYAPWNCLICRSAFATRSMAACPA